MAAEVATETADRPKPAATRAEVRILVDLSLGAWRPREAARQLALALGIDLGPGLPPDPANSPITLERRGLDVGATGDPVAFLCLEDARRIASALPPTGTITILAPRFGRGIGTLNDWFFHFLRRTALQLSLVGPEPATVMARAAFERSEDSAAPPPGEAIEAFPDEQQRLLRFFPGLLPRRIVTHAGLDASAAAIVPLGTSHFLVPPAYRDTDPATAATTLDAMAVLEELDEGFTALAQTFCTAHFADSEALARLAADAFHSGETDLARELATRARVVARVPEAAETADLVRQEIRLHQQRHAEILASPEPSRRASERTRQRLARLRLRAAIARGERGAVPAGVEALIARLDAGTPTPDELQLLCLHVATRLAANDTADLAALAGRVAKAVETAGDDRLLIEVLGLRTAIARRSGDLGAARRFLARQAAATAGSRSLAEIVTMNVQHARLEDDPASEAARAAWLRAAFAWLAFEPFEAFPTPAVESVLGTTSVPRGQLDQSISETITRALGQWGPGEKTAAEELLPAVHFRRSGIADPERMIGGPGVSLLWSRQMDWVPPSPFRQQLLAAAWSMFRQLFPEGEAREGTIVVDDNLGDDLPATREAALGAALRLGVPEVRFGTERIVLDATNRPRLATDLRIGLSPAVSGLSGPGEAPVVRFRRHFADLTVTGEEAVAVGALGEGGRMPLGTLSVLMGRPLAETERLMRVLEAKRVVRVELAPPRARPDASPDHSPGSDPSSASA